MGVTKEKERGRDERVDDEAWQKTGALELSCDVFHE